MRIARTFEGKGWTSEQYDALIEKLGGVAAPGVVFHWAAKTDDGMLAVDVYESREAADRLAEQIGPAAAELGMPLPNITEYEVHATLAP